MLCAADGQGWRCCRSPSCVFAAPAGSATAPQPVIVLPPSVNATLPVGAVPVTVAVKVTLVPTTDGLAELASACRCSRPC